MFSKRRSGSIKKNKSRKSSSTKQNKNKKTSIKKLPLKVVTAQNKIQNNLNEDVIAPIILVLDLDHTLVECVDATKAAQVVGREPDIKIFNDDFLIFTRPCLHYFISMMTMCGFEFVIWSAGSEVYAETVTEYIFQNHTKKPLAVFSEPDCDFNHIFNQKTNKPLLKLAKHLGRKSDISRMLLIDDIESNGIDNPNNIITVKMYNVLSDELCYQLCGIHDAVLYKLGHLLCNFLHHNKEEKDTSRINVSKYTKIIQQMLNGRIQ